MPWLRSSRLNLQKPLGIFLESFHTIAGAEIVCLTVVLIALRRRVRLDFHVADGVNHIVSRYASQRVLFTVAVKDFLIVRPRLAPGPSRKPARGHRRRIRPECN